MDLRTFYREYMEHEQLKQAATIETDTKLLLFIVYSYNCYEVLHSKEKMSLITNPDALFITRDEEQAFIVELKQYIRDVVGIQPISEDKRNGKNNRNCTNQKITKN